MMKTVVELLHDRARMASVAIKHLEAILKAGCDPVGEGRCNWCGGDSLPPFDYTMYDHRPACPWPEARAFLDGCK